MNSFSFNARFNCSAIIMACNLIAKVAFWILKTESKSARLPALPIPRKVGHQNLINHHSNPLSIILQSIIIRSFNDDAMGKIEPDLWTTTRSRCQLFRSYINAFPQILQEERNENPKKSWTGIFVSARIITLSTWIIIIHSRYFRCSK